MSDAQALQGSIERVTYHNSETGYCVLKVKVKAHSDLVTVVGHISSATPGEFIESEGIWIQHRDFGLQFKAEQMKSIHPSTLEGIEKYLGSGMVKGIGPHFAKKLVEAFKAEVFEVIENSPQKLRQVTGIGTIRIHKITLAWHEQKVIREIMVFLQSHGVSTARSVRIYKTYGDHAISKVKENPYQLARDIHGIGFKTADQIAFQLGISKTSLIRARAGIQYALQEHIGEGHCAYPENLLLQNANQLLEIEEAILKQAIELELQDRFLIREEIEGILCLYTAALYRYENEIARMIASLHNLPAPWQAIDIAKAVETSENQIGIQLDPLQKEAISQALSSKLLIITGGPGTGKTTLTRSILGILKSKGVRLVLGSPTGRAAKRLSECTGIEAKTLHRILGFDPKKNGFLHDNENPLPADLVLVDEASMIDVALMYHLLKAIPKTAAVIFVGDVDQLPSVGPGTILKSLIDSEAIPTVRLTQIFRQTSQSQIIQAAHRVRQGLIPDLERKDKTSDFHFISLDEPEITLSKIIELVTQRIPKAFQFDPIKDIQVLCPMNRGVLGTRSLNSELQKSLNANPEIKIERFGVTYAPGDKVMVIANDYDKEVFNGDIGIIESIDLTEQEALIDFEGKSVVFEFNEMDILSLAYAISIHKSQGSEYPAVVIPLSTQHFTLLKRNLIYTGMTRGKKLVVLVGQKKALAIAIKTKDQGLRWNSLANRIISAIALLG